MNRSESLFALIQSLTPGERRSVTIAIRSHRYSKAYLKMFGEMLRQQRYEEDKLKECLKDEPFIAHFAVIKSQLFNFILKVLRSFHEGSSLDFMLKELMLDAAVLSQKALHTESWHKLQRARELAMKFEDWKVLLEILYKEFVLIPTIKIKSTLQEEYARISKELETFLSYLNNYETFAYHYLLLSSLIKQDDAGTNAGKAAAMKKIMSAPIFHNENNALTLRAKMIYFHSRASYSINMYAYDEAEFYLMGQIELFKDNSHFIEWIPGNYVLALRDLIACQYTRENFSAAEKLIQELKKLSRETKIKKIQGPRFSTLILAWTFRYETGIAVALQKQKELLPYIKTQETVFMKSLPVLEPDARLETLLALAVFYYYLPDPQKAARLVEKLLGDTAAHKYPHLALLALTLKILLHFADSDMDMISYILKEMNRLVKGRKIISATEKMLVAFCAGLPSLSQGKNKRQSLQKFLDAFLLLKKDNYEKKHYLFFDITFWLEKYLKRRM